MRWTLVFVALTLATVGMACSNDTPSLPPARTLEKSSAINLGDGVCKSLATDRQQLISDFKKAHPQPSNDDAREFLVNTLAPRIESAVGDFHRIGEPTKDRTGWDAIVSDLDKDLTDYKAQISTDPVKLIDVKPFAKEKAAFDAYGFKDCGTAVS